MPMNLIIHGSHSNNIIHTSFMAAYAVSAVLRSLAEAAIAARQAQRAGSWELVEIINDDGRAEIHCDLIWI